MIKLASLLGLAGVAIGVPLSHNTIQPIQLAQIKAHEMSEEELQHFESLMYQLDEDGSKGLDPIEIRSFLKVHFGINPTEAELEAWISEADDGELDVKEFAKFYSQLIFRLFDVNRDGLVDVKELHEGTKS